MENNNNNTGFGLSTWDEKNNVGRRETNREELPRIEYLRLKEGNNVLRIVSQPYKYYMIRYKAPGDTAGYGKRVNCSYPKYEDCPCVEAGYKPKSRYLVGVIERGAKDKDGNPAPAIRLFDMSVLVYEQLQSFKDDPEVGVPDSYDINVRFNPKASSPQGFYSVIPRPKAALSEADVNLIEAVGADNIHKTLLRQSTPLPPEFVRKRLESLGWTGKREIEPKGAAAAVAELETATDEDTDFPAAQAN